MAKPAYDKRRPDIALAISLGWKYCGMSGSGHLQFEHPHYPRKYTCAQSASDPRSVKNSMAWIKRNTP